MYDRTNRSQIPNQQTIADQITTFDIGLRRELAKNSSQTYVRSSFQITEEQGQVISRKGSIKSAWFECGSNQMNQTYKDRGLSCIQSFESRGNSQKKTIKIYSLANVKRQRSIKKTEGKSQKINVSLNKKTEKKSTNDIWSTYIDKRGSQKDAKQNQSLFQEQKIQVDLNLPLKQQILVKRVGQIKQPDFHSKHPLQGNHLHLNGAFLSKMITAKALQTKTKPLIVLQKSTS